MKKSIMLQIIKSGLARASHQVVMAKKKRIIPRKMVRRKKRFRVIFISIDPSYSFSGFTILIDNNGIRFSAFFVNN